MALNAPQDFGQPFVLEDFMPVEPPVTFTSPPLCAVCQKPVSHHQRCSGCKNINYCSKDCQSTAWPQHKLLCKPFTASTRPTSSSRRALFFPPDHPRPHFIFLAYATDGTPLDIAQCFPNTPTHEIKTIGFHNRFLPYWIQLWYDNNANGNRLLCKNAAMQYAFRGPVVALAYDAEEGLSKPAVDVDTRALGPVGEYARLREEYGGPVCVEQPQERWTGEEWEGYIKGTRTAMCT